MYFEFQKFLRASRGIVSKTVLVESEESYSDYRVMRNLVMRGLGVHIFLKLKNLNDIILVIGHGLLGIHSYFFFPYTVTPPSRIHLSFPFPIIHLGIDSTRRCCRMALQSTSFK